MTFPLAEGLRPGGRYEQWHPQPPRYAVADVDGTLVGSSPRATDAVVAAALAAAAAGIAVGFATGRLAAGVRELHEQLGLPGPHVVHNGAQVRAGGRSLATWPLHPQAVRALLDLCAGRNLYAEVYIGDGFVVTDRREAARPHWERVTSDPDGLVADIDLDAVEVLKVTVVVFAGDDLDSLLADVAGLGLVAGPATSPQTPGMTFVNVTDPAADKGRALRFAAQHLGCSLNEVVAVGDGLNDLSMLAVAGTAIAMGQAEAAVRDAAHLIVPEVEADGVAHALLAAVAWRAG